MTRMVVFDMAGTTVDENNVVYKTLQKAINETGCNISLQQVLDKGAGLEKFQAIKNIMGAYTIQTDDAIFQAVYSRFVTLLENTYRDLEIFEMPGAKALFHALKERQTFVVLNTGYSRETAGSLINKLGWEIGVDYDALITASDVLQSRPNPAMILLAIKDFKLTNAADVMKVGDSIVDIEEGKNAGCGQTIGITTGAHNRQQLQTASPSHIIDKLPDILPLL